MKYRYLFIFLMVLVLSIGAVSAQEISSDDIISIEQNNNVLASSEFTVDDSSYDTYFESTGDIREDSNISDGDTLLIGNVTDKTFNIDKNLTVTQADSDSVAVNSTFNIMGTVGSKITDLTIVNNGMTEAIYVYDAEDLIISGNVITLSDRGDDDSFAIYVEAAKNLEIAENDIVYYGKSNGSYINNAIRVIDSEIVSVDSNYFTIEIPAASAYDSSWAFNPRTEGLSFIEVENLTVIHNSISLNATDAVAMYDTIYVVDIQDSDNALFYDNGIDANGHSYIYAVRVSSNDFTVSNNIIEVTSDTDTAEGIAVEGTATGIVENNTISAKSVLYAYGIYSASYAGDVNVTYNNNTITAESDISYGMTLMGTDETVTSNTITAKGNKTIAFASANEDVTLENNTIIADGANVGNTTSSDLFGDDTVAVYLINSTAIVSNNNITSTSLAIVADNCGLDISDNIISSIIEGSVDVGSAVFLIDSSASIEGNSIEFTSTIDNAPTNLAVVISNCEDVDITGNGFDVEIPSVANDFDYTTYETTYNSVALRVADSTNVVLEDNNFYVSYNNASGDYDSLYGIMVTGSEDVNINTTYMEINGHTCTYAINLNGNNVYLTESEIYSDSDNNQATGISVENSGSFYIYDNELFVSAPNITYGIVSQTYGSELNASYMNNTIDADSSIVYAVRLAGTNDEFIQNEISAVGDLAMGIGSSSANASIKFNTIEAKGTGSSDVSSFDSLSPETVGVKIAGGNAYVTDNTIKTNGEYSVNASNTSSTVAYNYLQSDLLYGDDSVFDEGYASVYNNTPDYDAFITAEDLRIYYRNGTRFTATLHTINGTPIANKTLTFEINGGTYNRTTDENGTAGMAINLKAGEYSMTVRFNPGENYTEVSESYEVIVWGTVDGEDIVKMYRNGTQYYATFVDGQGNYLANGTKVSFNINGVFYTRQINGSEGKARLNINLAPGEYIITATNPVNGEQYSNDIIVLALIDDNEDIVKYFKNDTQYVVTVYGEDGNVVGAGENVTFNINGVFYTRQTNASGQAKININLQPGDYVITATYKGCSVSNDIEVLPILYAEDLVKKYGTSDQFRVLLLDGQGNPYANQQVTFNIHGVFYTRTTNSDGYASLNIALRAAVDTYIVTSSFNGTSISNTITVIP